MSSFTPLVAMVTAASAVIPGLVVRESNETQEVTKSFSLFSLSGFSLSETLFLMYDYLHNCSFCRDTTEATLHTDTRLLNCGKSSPVRVEHEVGAASWLWGPWRRQVCRDSDCLCRRVMALSESLFQPLVASDQEASMPSFSL